MLPEDNKSMILFGVGLGGSVVLVSKHEKKQTNKKEKKRTP